MSRCVATNAAGARCLFSATHGNDFHLYADDRDAYAYRYGSLSAAVKAFLDGEASRDFLARAFAETEASKFPAPDAGVDLPPAPVDLMDQLREALAAANRTLSTKPPQREASGVLPAVDAPAAAPTDQCGPCSLDVHDDCHRHDGDQCGCADTPTCGASLRVFSTAGGES